MDKYQVIAVAASGVSAAALAFAVAQHVADARQVAAARGAQHSAEQTARTAEARPARTVTEAVPTFGRSVLLGVYAAGRIAAGGMGPGANAYTPDDANCSAEYTTDSGMPNAVAIDRPQYMTACETNVYDTARQDTAK